MILSRTYDEITTIYKKKKKKKKQTDKQIDSYNRWGEDMNPECLENIKSC